MERADDYLHGPLLALPPIEETPTKSNPNNTTQNSFRSNMTGMTSKMGNKDFLQMNKD